jgi:hypothetical protein
MAPEGIRVEETAQSHRPAAYRSHASRASIGSIGERSALLPSPNRIRKTADNGSYVNYINLHAEATPYTQMFQAGADLLRLASLALAGNSTRELGRMLLSGGIRFVERARTGRCPCDSADSEGCQDCRGDEAYLEIHVSHYSRWCTPLTGTKPEAADRDKGGPPTHHRAGPRPDWASEYGDCVA